jgi:hypothetical protein
MDWIDVAQDKEKGIMPVFTGVNLQDPEIVGKFLSGWNSAQLHRIIYVVQTRLC